MFDSRDGRLEQNSFKRMRRKEARVVAPAGRRPDEFGGYIVDEGRLYLDDMRRLEDAYDVHEQIKAETWQGRME